MATGRWSPIPHGDRVSAALVDHLWQSVGVFALLWGAAALARGSSAAVRLWTWRLAALKFLVPFAVLFAVGRWVGYPVAFTTDEVPPLLSWLVDGLTPIAAPARTHEVAGPALAGCVLVLLAASIAAARVIRDHLRLEHGRVEAEAARAALDPDDTEPGLGFLRGALFAALALLLVSTPLIGGAVEDHRFGRELLVENSRALRDADVVMTQAAPGMGERMRIRVTAGGVFIRNATLQELAGLAYGVSRFMVRGQHFVTSQKDDWLIGERFDITIAGRIVEPGRFDTYALRRPVTRMLANRYGYELYLNGDCQPPCGRYGVPIPEKPL